MEIGPWRIDEDGDLQTVQGGWEEYTTVVYGRSIMSGASTAYNHVNRSSSVDQPAGTGFSYTSTDHFVHTLEVVRVPIVWTRGWLISDYATSGD